jgi:hypothetical protein
VTLEIDQRQCPICDNEISARATRCKYCFEYVQPISAPAPTVMHSWDGPSSPNIPVPDPFSTSTSTHVSLGARAVKRYRDAYMVARSIDAQGQSIKSLAVVVAVILGIATTVVAMASARASESLALPMLICGAIAAGLCWSTIHSRGVSIAAEGQQLLASLDVAVHTSPFMSDSERAESMEL